MPRPIPENIRGLLDNHFRFDQSVGLKTKINRTKFGDMARESIMRRDKTLSQAQVVIRANKFMREIKKIPGLRIYTINQMERAVGQFLRTFYPKS